MNGLLATAIHIGRRLIVDNKLGKKLNIDHVGKDLVNNLVTKEVTKEFDPASDNVITPEELAYQKAQFNEKMFVSIRNTFWAILAILGLYYFPEEMELLKSLFIGD